LRETMVSPNKRPRKKNNGSGTDEHDDKRIKKEHAIHESATGDASEASFHRLLVEVIYDLGLTQSSPQVLLENMAVAQNHEAITSERVKSKLQKYRNNKEKSKQEFLDEYDKFLIKARDRGLLKGGDVASTATIRAMLVGTAAGETNAPLLGGDAAAYLSLMSLREQSGATTTYSNMDEPLSSVAPPPAAPPQRNLHQEAQQFLQNFDGRGVYFPKLTEAEKQSPLGVSLIYVMGLFMQMTQLINAERAKAQKNGAPFTMPTVQETLRSIPGLDPATLQSLTANDSHNNATASLERAAQELSSIDHHHHVPVKQEEED
jgi:hypothetical protein